MVTKYTPEQKAEAARKRKKYQYYNYLYNRYLHPELYREYAEQSKQRAKERRLRCLQHYSKSIEPFCACCNEKTVEFLGFDHIHGEGDKERKKSGNSGGAGFYAWIVKNNFPEGFQILCFNCNQARTFNGYCPHDQARLKAGLPTVSPWFVRPEEKKRLAKQKG